MAVPVLVHKVTRYTTRVFDGPIDPETGARARIWLFEDENLVARLEFRDQTQSIPEPNFVDAPTGYYPLSTFAGLLAVLGNGDGVTIRINAGAAIDPEERDRAIMIVSGGAVKNPDAAG